MTFQKLQPDVLHIDRLPPHALESEQGVLGCILLAPDECLPECMERIRDTRVFYDLRHQAIYENLVEMYDARKPIDSITFYSHLHGKSILDEVGGMDYVSGLPDVVPSAAHLPCYLDILCEKAMLRSLLVNCTDTVAKIYEFEGQPRQVVEEHEREVLQLLTDRRETKLSIKDAVKSAIDTISFLHEKKSTGGLMTGLTDFDQLTCGLMPANVTVIAARPSVGKTSLGMQIAEYNAVDCKVPVGVFSLEMSSPALVLRLLCSRARVDSKAIKRGYLTEGDFKRLSVASAKIANAPIYIDDSSGLSLVQLRTKARRMHQLHGIKLFVIDQLSHIHNDRKKDGRQQEVSDISRGIHDLAKDLNVHIVLICQLNREPEKTAGKKSVSRRPRMSDLRESGAIEGDADLIALLSKNDEKGYSVMLDLVKARDGETDPVNLTFLKQFTRFENAAPETTDDE